MKNKQEKNIDTKKFDEINKCLNESIKEFKKKGYSKEFYLTIFQEYFKFNQEEKDMLKKYIDKRCKSFISKSFI